MNIFSIFTLLGGLAFFLFGMNHMSNGLKKLAGGKLETMVNKMTENRFSGLLLGCVLTIAIQSSSAVTVMLVGLVNSGIMDIAGTVGVIMGSNIGTTITAWIMSLIGISGDNLLVNMMKPESFAPLLAFIGILMVMVAKREKKQEIGNIFLGFAILMYGMMLMSGSVAPLAEEPKFMDVLTAFNNPFLGILAGFAVTAVIQSSAASVGMLQALALTGGVSYGMAIPIIMGQNIGTCVTAVLSSIGVSRNARRVAVIHISFNIIGTVCFMIVFYGLHSLVEFTFLNDTIDPVGIAVCHTLFNLFTTAILLPFTKLLVKIAEKAIKTDEDRGIAFLDERLFNTPHVALGECEQFMQEMAASAKESIGIALSAVQNGTDEGYKEVQDIESDIDTYEDHLGRYLVRISGADLKDSDSRKVTEMLNVIGNIERMGDHAVDIMDSACEMKEKHVTLSERGTAQLDNIIHAVLEIVDISSDVFMKDDIEGARSIEPLEQVIDGLIAEARAAHIERLTRNECSIENGFVLNDILNSIERISDHCSNIGAAVLGLDPSNPGPHEFLGAMKSAQDPEFNTRFNEYKDKYSI